MEMEWKLSEGNKGQYDSFLRAAQETESNIGSATYRLFKLNVMRDELDRELKGWWDKMIKELSLDPRRDYMITKDGLIQDVTKPAKNESLKPTPAPSEEDKPITVNDLK